VPFGDAMRHELGSKAEMPGTEISCYQQQLINQRHEILGFNDFLTKELLAIIDK
jgi:hypothetical protein